jgi:hypothetical protein
VVCVFALVKGQKAALKKKPEERNKEQKPEHKNKKTRTQSRRGDCLICLCLLIIDLFLLKNKRKTMK